jgi:hypothetical protein
MIILNQQGTTDHNPKKDFTENFSFDTQKRHLKTARL